MMRLSELLADSVGDQVILDMTLDSREVKPGSLFVAIPGADLDGRHFIDAALSAGAAAVLAESADYVPPEDDRIVRMEGVRQHLGALAARFFAYPSRQMRMIAVTGTNGKTSIVDLSAQLLRLLGVSAGSVGTLGIRRDQSPVAARNTTPDCLSLHRQLREWCDQGVTHVAMEASSHALDQGRLDGLNLDVGLWTNLTRDHLDYHGSMEAYRAAKLSLLTRGKPALCLFNLDDAALRSLPEEVDIPVMGISDRHPEADIFFEVVTLEPALRVSIRTPWGQSTFESALTGRFNAFNLVAAIAAVTATGRPFLDVVEVVRDAEPVLGRLQRIDADADIAVIIDYAHTPDALERSLSALVEQMHHGKLWVVFGCGGDRDRGKRAEMGAIATRLADEVVVTSDNPRTEDPARIIDDVVKGCAGDAYRVEPDRAAAIHLAVAEASSGDTVLISGKGHETYQEIRGSRLPFSDAQSALQALELRRAA